MSRNFLLFLSIELKLAWREQQKQFGRFSPLFSPTLVLASYVILNLLCVTLVEVSGRSGPKAPTLGYQGTVLIALVLLLFTTALPACISTFTSRNDWDLIRSAPNSTLQLMLARLTALSLRVASLPLLLATPLANVFVFQGDFIHLCIYPVLICAAFGVTGVSSFLVVGTFVFIRHRLDGVYAQGIVLLVLAGMVALQFTPVSFEAFSNMSHPMSLQWAGGALFGKITASISLSILAITMFAVGAALTSRLIPRLRHSTPKINSATAERGEFARTLGVAVMKKEWRLAVRNTGFIFFIARIVAIVGTLALLFNRAGQIESEVLLGPAIIIVVGLIANDLSWLMSAAESMPDLLTLSPVTPPRLRYFKILAASLPAASVLIVMSAILATSAPLMAMSVVLLGTASMTLAIQINSKWANRLCTSNLSVTSTPKQSGLLVFLQGVHILGFAGFAYALN